jgi:hypothetical protein
MAAPEVSFSSAHSDQAMRQDTPGRDQGLERRRARTGARRGPRERYGAVPPGPASSNAPSSWLRAWLLGCAEEGARASHRLTRLTRDHPTCHACWSSAPESAQWCGLELRGRVHGQSVERWCVRRHRDARREPLDAWACNAPHASCASWPARSRNRSAATLPPLVVSAPPAPPARSSKHHRCAPANEGASATIVPFAGTPGRPRATLTARAVRRSGVTVRRRLRSGRD